MAMMARRRIGWMGTSSPVKPRRVPARPAQYRPASRTAQPLASSGLSDITALAGDLGGEA